MKFSKTLYWNKRNGRLGKKYLLQETASEHELKIKSWKSKLHCSYEYIPDWKWICIWEHMNDYQISPKMEDKSTLSYQNETIRRNVHFLNFLVWNTLIVVTLTYVNMEICPIIFRIKSGHHPHGCDAHLFRNWTPRADRLQALWHISHNTDHCTHWIAASIFC